MHLEQAPIRFGRFEIRPLQRELLANGERVVLHARAFDLLSLLIEHRDRALSRDEIMTRVWGGLAVAPNNLSVQLSSLRKALAEAGEDATLIQTLPGPCYRFIGEVEEAALAVTLPEEKPELPLKRQPPLRMVTASCVALLLLASLSAVWLGLGRRSVAPGSSSPVSVFSPPPLSIVVLPFRTLADDHNLQYLADSLAEDLTTALGRIVASTVIARESADTYRGKPVFVQQIGHDLNVRYAVEGSLRLDSTAYHINLQLIETATGRQLWGDSIDVPQDRMSGVQDDIVRRIAAVLDGKLLAQDVVRSLQDRPNDPQAIDFFLRGRYHYAGHDDLAGVTKSQHYFEQALALSPDYVDALIALGQLLLSKASNYDSTDSAEDLQRAHQLIAHAAELSPGDAKVLCAQGDLHRSDNNFAAARDSYEAGLAADPNNVQAQTGLAKCDWWLGRFEPEISHLLTAKRLDPLGPLANLRNGPLGMANFMLGHYQTAIDSLELELATVPPADKADDLGRVEFDMLFLMAAYAESGETSKAQEVWHEYSHTWKHRSAWRMLAYLSGAQARTPGYVAFREGLIKAGMPEYTDVEHAETLPETECNDHGGDFAATPASISNGFVLDKNGARTLVTGHQTPMIVDVGRGAAVFPGALWTEETSLQETGPADEAVDDAKRNSALLRRPVIVIGTGVYGRVGYLAALRLIKAGFTQVEWFRGGEEAWAAAGLPSEDKRKP